MLESLVAQMRNPDERRIIELRFFRGLTQSQIAAELGARAGFDVRALDASHGMGKEEMRAVESGVTVRTRQGYSALTEPERAQDRVEATMKTNLSYSAIPVALRTAPAARDGRTFTLPITVTFPASALTFVPDGRSVTAGAEFWFGAVDDEGRSSDVSHQETTFTPSGGAPDAPLTYRATLRLRKGANRIVVNVRDKATGKMGTAKANVQVR